MRINSGLGSLTRPQPLSSKAKLFIALPTRGTCDIEFAISMTKTVADLISRGVDVLIKRSEMSCFVDMSRNRLVADFLKSDCTHLLFIDDDMGWDHTAVFKMLQKDKDFIAAAGPKKQDAEQYACTWHCNPDLTPVVAGGLFHGEYVGGAFCLIKREVFAGIQKELPHLRCRAIDEEAGFRFYEAIYDRDTWRTEDYVFCDRAKAAGFTIWIYPDVSFTHSGTKRWNGNLHRFMVKKPDPDGCNPNQKIAACENWLDRAHEVVKTMGFA